MKKWTAAAASLLLMLAACGNEENEASTNTKKESGEPLTVYTTIYPLQYFAERIGGDTIEAESMLPAYV